ncbi:MAG: hypothetical protein AAF438_13640 [Pseudomonadota bacterium]
MMQKIQEVQVETSDWLFSIEVFKRDDGAGYIAEYWGTHPKAAPSPPVGEPAETVRASSPRPIVVEGLSVQELIQRCKAEIADKFGAIENSRELDSA